VPKLPTPRRRDPCWPPAGKPSAIPRPAASGARTALAQCCRLQLPRRDPAWRPTAGSPTATRGCIPATHLQRTATGFRTEWRTPQRRRRRHRTTRTAASSGCSSKDPRARRRNPITIFPRLPEDNTQLGVHELDERLKSPAPATPPAPRRGRLRRYSPSPLGLRVGAASPTPRRRRAGPPPRSFSAAQVSAARTRWISNPRASGSNSRKAVHVEVAGAARRTRSSVAGPEADVSRCHPCRPERAAPAIVPSDTRRVGPKSPRLRRNRGARTPKAPVGGCGITRRVPSGRVDGGVPPRDAGTKSRPVDTEKRSSPDGGVVVWKPG